MVPFWSFFGPLEQSMKHTNISGSGWIRVFITSLMVGTLPQLVTAQTAPPTTEPSLKMPPGYIIGADMSWVQQREESGRKYSENGVEKDPLLILKEHGFNYIRLRVFNDPTMATWNPTQGGGR